MLLSHDNSDECKATLKALSKKGMHLDGKCMMCDETVLTFLQYKCHLFGHFEEV